MVSYKEHRLLVLPDIVEPNSLYFIGGGKYVEMYVTNKKGVVREVGNTKMINELFLSQPIKEHRVFNETPLGIMNGVNVNFTTLHNFIPETMTVFLNGIFQKVVIDFNTTGNNTLILTNSPSSLENILINYTKL
jgi:hypothetical protein